MNTKVILEQMQPQKKWLNINEINEIVGFKVNRRIWFVNAIKTGLIKTFGNSKGKLYDRVSFQKCFKNITTSNSVN